MIGDRDLPANLPSDYLDDHGLLSLDLDESRVAALLRGTPLTGHDGRPVVETQALADLLDALRGDSYA